MNILLSLIVCSFLLSSKVMANKHFPKDYNDSRKNFLNLVKKIKDTEIKTIKVPSVIDQGLFIDFAYLSPTASTEKIIVLSSGVHGPEAYAGAAVLDLFLRDHLKNVDRTSTGILLIHSINPFGFKYHTRNTENNVNLNRNFHVRRELFSNQNPGYKKLNEILNPIKKVSSPILSSLGTARKLLTKVALKKATIKELNQAISGGQYKFQKGIEFGGFDFEPNVDIVRKEMKRILKNYDKILSLDVHTGLGIKNELHMLAGSGTTPAVKKRIAKMFKEGEDSGAFKITYPSDEGFYHTTGDFIDFVGFVSPKSASEVIAITPEYGTLGDSLVKKLDTLSRLVQQNQGFHHGYKSESIKKKVADRYQELFFPADQEWRDLVVSKADVMLKLAIKNF